MKKSAPPRATPTRNALAARPEAKQKIVHRLNRIEGQVRGLRAMVEDERYCVDVLVQLSAIHESLRGVGRELLRHHLEHCATHAIQSKNPARITTVCDELTHLFYQHAR